MRNDRYEENEWRVRSKDQHPFSGWFKMIEEPFIYKKSHGVNLETIHGLIKSHNQLWHPIMEEFNSKMLPII